MGDRTPAAKCQCLRCLRYLAQNRLEDESVANNYCSECYVGGLPLAKIRGTLTAPLDLEVLALLVEEGGEVAQRVGKITRWGWEADFAGSTQRHKLETELGDVLVAVGIAVANGLVTFAGIVEALRKKTALLIEDSEGPKQRLLHAEVPNDAYLLVGLTNALAAQDPDGGGRAYLRANLLAGYCSKCDDALDGRTCYCDRDPERDE